MDFETARCVVLNATYEPISIVSSKRALLLILEGKATVVEEHPSLVVRSMKFTLKVPIMVALKEFVRARRQYKATATLTRKNLFLRDNNTCQYCARHAGELKNSEFLTRDHVIPESRGGKSTWTNLVTACSTCNSKKSNHNLSDVDMTLLRKPVAPSSFDLWIKLNERKFIVQFND
jgi:5-methylcytosine-specific restriction endonuclease McrA